MTPFYTDDSVTLYHGDCLEVLASLPDCSVDSVVTDPPYGLGFMGREWDDLPPGIEFATECLRVLKPGGHMLAFGGSRTWHRLTCAVEDAGFEIRDSIAWLYGSGFPKSLDVSKAIDKAAGAEPIDVGVSPNWRESKRDREKNGQMEVRGENAGRLTTPATPDAQKWQGWGTALKPAFEPIVVARKPLAGTVSQNVLAYGTGALNVDACRVESDDETGRTSGRTAIWSADGDRPLIKTDSHAAGRWPSNVVLDDSQATELDADTGHLHNPGTRSHRVDRGPFVSGDGESVSDPVYADSGGASRFFPTFKYEPKAPTTERPRENGTAHPTVKPLDLMRWLVRLVTPPGGTVLEPFAGSGTTAEACVVEGFKCVAVEREADYLPLIVQRLSKPIQVALEFD